MRMNERMRKAAVALFFMLLTLVGLWTVDDYTGSYDEIAEQAILSSNMKEYALALEKRGISWNTWLESHAVPISQSIEKDHGISGYYLYGLLFPQIEQNETLRYTLWGIVTWLWFMSGVWSLYAIARHLNLSRTLACTSALLLYLSPRFFAEGHLNNKDVVLLCMMLITLCQGARYLDKPGVLRGLLFSLAGAAAMNTKIVAVIVWGLVMMAMILKITIEKSWNRKNLTIVALTVLGFAGIYLLLTPAMWKDPLGFFPYLFSNAATFSRWEGRMFFRGASFQIPENPLPVYYLAYMMLTTLPLYVFPLFAFGQIESVLNAIRKPKAFLTSTPGLLLVCATGCWVASMGAFVLLRPLVYNGWRHFYFTYAGVAVLASYGVKVLWDWCAARRWMKPVCAGVLCLCFAATAVGMVINHPRQSSYYNALSGSSLMETDYWNTSGTYALKRLLGCEERNTELPLEVGCYFFDIQNARFKMTDKQKAVLTTTVEKDSPYLYYIENYAQVYDVKPPEGYHVLFEVDSYGRRIGIMYEKDK